MTQDRTSTFSEGRTRLLLVAWLGLLVLEGCSTGIVGAAGDGGSDSPVDADQDGYRTQVDCNDADSTIHPGAADTCGDGVDQDCSGTDAACPSCGDTVIVSAGCLCEGAHHTDGNCCANTWHADGYCCAGAWQGSVCATCADGDGDGYDEATCGGNDCNDADVATHPGATEVCNDGVDQDCAGGDLVCPADTTPPAVSGGQPTGTLPGGTSQVTLRVTTNEVATCKWNTSPGASYDVMANTFATTGGTSHNSALTGLADGQSYTRYVRCQDGAGNANTSDYAVSFNVGTGAGPLTMALVPSRLSGVAPLSVFFDAAGTTSTGTARPFHELEYRWDFGDPAGSPVNGTTWRVGSGAGVNSRNSATGPVAAHVFERPGTFTVAVSAFDGTNTATTSATITVEDPGVIFAGTNTICVAATSTPVSGAGGCPGGASTVLQADFATAIRTYALTGRRVLFKRGDTFTAAAAASITRTGPGSVGAFGAGAAPVVQMTGNAHMLTLSSGATPTMNDWRIMDLEFDGLSKSDAVAIEALGGVDQVLILNMTIHDVYRGIIFSDSLLSWLNNNGSPGHEIWDQLAIVDSTVTGPTAGWRIFASASRFSILGNELGNMRSNVGMGSHVIRTPYIGKGVIANNAIARSALNLAIKMHGPVWCDVNSPAGQCIATDNSAPPASYTYSTTTHPIGIFAATSGYTEQVVVSDNEIIGANSPYLVVAGPQNANRDERVRDLIVERNWFKAGNGSTQVAVMIHSYETTVRNNICDMTGGAAGVTCFNSTLYNGGPARPPHDIRIYNNTAYRSGGGSGFTLAKIDTTSTNVAVRNNLAYAPLSSPTTMVSGSGASGFIQSNNSTDAQMRSTFPGWVSSTPSTPANFSLAAGSYARDTGGAGVPVFSDFVFRTRPSAEPIDMGAVEGPL